MNFAKKLRDVVAANFIEIAREDETPAPLSDVSRGSAEEKDSYAESATDFDTVSDAEDTDEHFAFAPGPAMEAPDEDAASPVENAPEPLKSRRILLGAFDPNEPVNIERVLREAELPHVPFNAEQASKVLIALPHDLPMAVKRLTVKATLEAIERSEPIHSKDIVADAMLRKACLGEYREAFLQQYEEYQRVTKSEIERLRQEMERLQSSLITAEQKRRETERAVEDRIIHLEQVIVFFQSEIAAAAEQNAPREENEEEVPPFMREESVKKMLGLNGVEGERSSDSDAEGSSEDAGIPSRKRLNRRNVGDAAA